MKKAQYLVRKGRKYIKQLVAVMTCYGTEIQTSKDSEDDEEERDENRK